MEKTLSVFVESMNETWEMGDDLALKLNEYQTEHNENGSDEKLYEEWFATLSAEEQQKIDRRKPDETAG